MPHHKPFIAVIKEQHNLDAIFVICLGKDGGFFSIGVPAMTHEVVFEKVPFLKNHKIYTVEL